ncbi:extracellular solute-binding protein [Synechococcus sp. RSCCF101]|uniref:extracellular solute-binding protein n=1 Tax=Synechococcus sp. RSCCF101 TaxID=2511069 RepID=UPI001244839E|nr:extracellular solute-binding protein [Synechococcus sp. RSCCF101]QEY32210.1 extracellular solute-binding protein [Synechococcus sp. RSCCF101]
MLLSGGVSLMAAAEAAEVRVYSGRHYNTDRDVFKRFSDQTGIRVRLLESTGLSLVERLKREGARSKADVIILVDAARINQAADAGLLQPVRSATLDRAVPATYRDPSGRWYGLTRRVRSIIVNPDKVSPGTIRTYQDLASPKLKGQLCLRKRSSVYNQSLVADQILLRGQGATRSWLNGITRNVTQPYYGNDVALVRAVASGRCGVGVVNHYYVARMRGGVQGKRDQTVARKVEVIMPKPAHVNISAAGVAKTARNKTEAIRLIEFLASPDGNKGLAGPTYEYPLRGSGSSAELRRLGSFTPDNVPIAKLARTQPTALKMMAEAGWK